MAKVLTIHELTNEEKLLVQAYMNAGQEKRDAKATLEALRPEVLDLLEKLDTVIINQEGLYLRKILKDTSKLLDYKVEEYLRVKKIWKRFSKASVDWDKLNQAIDAGEINNEEFRTYCMQPKITVELRTN